MFFTAILLSSIVGTFLIYQVFLDIQSDLPPLGINNIRDKMRENSVVIDKYGDIVANLAEESYISVSYDELPQSLIDAITAAEDARFFTHKGIDGPRTINAVITNSLLKQVTSGGSTITQQLIKVTSLQNKIQTDADYKDSNERKVHEWILAHQLEAEMSKEDILSSYFNTLGYGRFTGVGTAAKRYFNKHISELTTAESALLAGIPQASTDNNPYKDMEKSTKRYNVVTKLMFDHKFISADEKIALDSIPLGDLLLTNQDEFTSKNFSYFSAVESELNQLFNITTADSDVFLPYYTGYKIYTAMDQEQQRFANELMDTNDYVDYAEMLQNIPYYYNNGITEDLNLQASFAVVDVKTGGIPAIGAARNFKEHGNNFALNGYRSPGSAIKPIIDYAPGMEKLGWTANTMFTDKKTYYSGTKNEVFNFSNSVTNQPISLQNAVSQSLNTVAVQAMQQVGVEYAGTIAGDLGISRAKELLEDNFLFESAALGGGLETTVVEMAGAYATFGNAGKFNTPYFITKVENDKGEIIYEHKQENTQILSPTTAQNMTNALIHTRNYGTPASGRKQVNRQINFAAKTGTSSYDADDRQAYGLSSRAEKDHWIVGYSPEYAIAVWTGFNVEDADFLSKTRGNVNDNKGYGSYIMATWMNKFAPEYTKFDFSVEKSFNATLSGIAVTLDYENGQAFWNRPTISYPTAMSLEIRKALGSIVYDIILVNKDGSEIHLNTVDANTLSYSFLENTTPETEKFKIIARFENQLAEVSDSTEVILDIHSRWHEEDTAIETPVSV
ncbi:hypothetical protein AwErysi_07360 [Erysipelotrichaceae bacterium]|nr:hypothetical protein AwErysi_07360 [Erysipelotrichaceae bacterium]